MLKQLDNHLEKIKLDPYIASCSRINCKWIRNTSVKKQKHKIIEENMDEFLHNLAMSKVFINIIQNPGAILKKQ